jgi:hypothetical protein
MTTWKCVRRARTAALLAAVLGTASALATAATPQDLLANYVARAGGPADASRGQAFFAAPHGRDWACASCHGTKPVSDGRHAATGKPIQALAPGANPSRFTDPDKAEKWFRRNCTDVVGRACTDAEKADVLAWLITLKR